MINIDWNGQKTKQNLAKLAMANPNFNGQQTQEAMQKMIENGAAGQDLVDMVQGAPAAAAPTQNTPGTAASADVGSPMAKVGQISAPEISQEDKDSLAYNPEDFKKLVAPVDDPITKLAKGFDSTVNAVGEGMGKVIPALATGLNKVIDWAGKEADRERQAQENYKKYGKSVFTPEEETAHKQKDFIEKYVSVKKKTDPGYTSDKFLEEFMPLKDGTFRRVTRMSTAQ